MFVLSFGALVGAAIAVPTSATACSDDGGDTFANVEDLETTSDGVLAISLRLWDYASQPEVELEVLLGQDAVGGSIEWISLTGGGSLLVFRPNAAFEEDTLYGLRLTMPGEAEPREGSLQIVPGSSDVDLTPEISAVNLLEITRPTGRLVCCEEEIDGCGDGCVASMRQEAMNVSIAVEPGGAGQWTNPALASTYVEVFSGVDGTADSEPVRMSADALQTGVTTAYGEAQASTYCARVDIVSLVDASRYSVTACADHQGDDFGVSDADLSDYLSQCDTPYWQDNGEPFNEPEPEPEPDGEGDVGHDDDDDDSGSDGTGDGDGGAIDGDKSGCACSATDTAPPVTAWALLMLVVGVCRRRR